MAMERFVNFSYEVTNGEQERVRAAEERIERRARLDCELLVSYRIVISKFLKRHSKAKRRAPAYSRALRLVRGVVQKNSPMEV